MVYHLTESRLTSAALALSFCKLFSSARLKIRMNNTYFASAGFGSGFRGFMDGLDSSSTQCSLKKKHNKLISLKRLLFLFTF